MKRIFSITLITIILVSLFPGCIKKTNDDPVFSLRTRKNRVVGEWICETGSIDIADQYGSVTYQITGNTYHQITPLSTYDGTANVSFSFEKDGKCHQSINLGGLTTSFNGKWNFNGNVGQSGKTQIVIHIEDASDPSGNYLFEGNDNQVTYEIEELRNKLMRLTLINKVTKDNGEIDSYSEHWTLSR
jgi:hypothetical protein